MLVPAQTAILLALRAGDAHGLGVQRRVSELTDGAITVLPGSLYPALSALQRARLVRVVREERPHKVYRLTAKGWGTSDRVFDAIMSLVSRVPMPRR